MRAAAEGSPTVKANRMPRRRLQTNSAVTSSSGIALPSKTTKALDTQRQHMHAYEYLCHVEECEDADAKTIVD